MHRVVEFGLEIVTKESEMVAAQPPNSMAVLG